MGPICCCFSRRSSFCLECGCLLAGGGDLGGDLGGDVVKDRGGWSCILQEVEAVEVARVWSANGRAGA